MSSTTNINSQNLNWPNTQSALTAIPFSTTLVTMALQTDSIVTIGCNLPFRALSIWHAYHNSNYYKILFDVSAMVSLAFPYGKAAVITMDVFSEYFNYVIHKKEKAKTPPKDYSLPGRLDPKILENAYKILNVPANKARDLQYCQDQKEKIVQDLQRRKDNLTSEQFTIPLQQLIDDANIAYNTIVKHIPQK